MGTEPQRRSKNHSCNLVKRRPANGGAAREEIVKGVPPEGKTGAKQACQGVQAGPEV